MRLQANQNSVRLSMHSYSRHDNQQKYNPGYGKPFLKSRILSHFPVNLYFKISSESGCNFTLQVIFIWDLKLTNHGNNPYNLFFSICADHHGAGGMYNAKDQRAAGQCSFTGYYRRCGGINTLQFQRRDRFRDGDGPQLQGPETDPGCNHRFDL